jgi:hypothetical protein
MARNRFSSPDRKAGPVKAVSRNGAAGLRQAAKDAACC